MRINYVLVDYENVKAGNLLELKQEHVRVVIFLGCNQAKVCTDLAMQMQSLGSRGEFVKISGNGPNALDFHIAFTIGEKCGGEQPATFHIISKDTGFDPLITYLAGKKIKAKRYESIADIQFVQAPQPKTATERATLVMEKLRKSSANKPRTLKTLSNTIRTFLSGKVSDKEVEAVVSALSSQKFIVVKGLKVTYTEVKP